MTAHILGLDPGPKDSAFVLFDGKRVLDHGHIDNEELLKRLLERRFGPADGPRVTAYLTVIEQLQNYGATIGRDVLDTAFWAGRFAQASQPFEQLLRTKIKRHLVRDVKAKDFDIRVALMNRFGGGFAITFKGHQFAALAVAVTWWDQHPQRKLEVMNAATV